MSCFWDSMFRKLTLDDYKFIGARPISPKTLVKLLKDKNVPLVNVRWQGELLAIRFMSEMMRDISVYKSKSFNTGHDTGGCDIFLALVCQIFQININHNYNGVVLKYENTKNVRKTLNFSSSRSHMS